MFKRNLSRVLAMTAIAGTMFLGSCKDDTSGDPATLDKSTKFEEDLIKDDKGNVIETIITITDLGEGTGTMTLTSDKTWTLNGLVFVNSGQTLTIEPGTLIKGKSGQGDNASALIVARGGKIMAEGTASKPIIFTSEADENDNLPATARGLWGGVILLGKAKLNSAPGETSIEGIPTSEPRGLYGGNEDDDNSGVLKYISIRHGGTDIGAGNEINGLTLGGVGRGTTLEYIEILANNDDGVEYFGGTASIKYLVSAYCADDAVDYDEGYRGKNQYIFVFQDPSSGDRGGEHDGGTDPEDGNPYATPVFVNCTYIGRGEAAGTRAVTFRDNAGGEYHNSIFINFSKGVDIEDLPGDGQDSKTRFDGGDLVWNNNIHWNIAGNDESKQILTASPDNTLAGVNLWGSTTGNTVEDPEMTGVVPSASGPAGTATGISDTFLDNVSYKGAFKPGATPWYDGWTKIQSSGLVQ